MKKRVYPNFSVIEMINVVMDNYIFIDRKKQNSGMQGNKNSLLLLMLLLSISFLQAQVPGINYSGVQSTYTVNNAISPISPVLSGGAPTVRTNVSTIAGNGTSGYSDGTTASPKFYSPTGIAIASSGNMYIADSQNHCIRKISATGYVTTFAGSGIAGFLNGTADVAQFNTPYAVAVDASENVYVTEATTNAIRKITPSGIVSTFAGNITTSGYLDGQDVNALFAAPKGMDFDASGNLYVADANNNRIRKISASGAVSTFVGDGTAGFLDAQGTSAKLNNPIGIAISSSGTLYVTDASNNRIRMISNTGQVTTFAGSGATGMVNGQGTAAQFSAPRAIAIDSSDNLYVLDYNNNRIRKITSSGAVTTLSGTGAFGAVNGAGTVATFKYPEGLAVDASGNVYAADVTNNCIRKITGVGDTSTYAGSATRGLENGQTGTMAMFNSPIAVVINSAGEAYVIDDFNSCIRKVTPSGIVTTFAGNTTTGYVDATGTAAYFNNPKGMAIDASGNIYVADTFNNRIRKITPSGVVTTIAGDGTAGYLDGQGTAARFNNPYGLTVDTAGNIYVADTKNSRIRKISTSGAVTTVAGYILSGFADGASTVARFKNPQGIVIDNATGILYVSDTTNNRIRKIAVDGTVSTFAGSFAGYQDDLGTAAYFNTPCGITRDASGNFYIGDYYNSVIRKIDSTGLVSTYAGNGSSDYVDGIGNVASFYFPVGVTTDATGNVYVADSYTQRIRKITSVNPYSISPALPLGMSFDTATGVISGTPTEIRVATTYTISASNYTGTGTTTISFATGTGSSAPSAPTASAQSFCNSATVANLTAAGTALKWYNVATGGTALASTTVLATGTYYVSQTVNSLESSRTAVAVTVNVTSAPTASAQSFCNSATVANLTATGTSLQWYNVATGGTALASTTALATGTYYVSQTLNSCESSRTAVAVTVNVTSAPTASAQSFCNSATVANLTATGTALKWYNVATGGTALASTTALATGTYYVSQTLNSCEGSRTAVAVTVNNTLVPTASSQTFNSGATVANLVATGTNLQWYTVSTGGTALASTTILSTGTYYVSQTLNSCESPRVAVSVTINTAPGAPTASAQTFCNSATVANLTATGTALKWYNVATGGTALASTTVLATGTYYVSQTVNSLESSRTAVAVTVNVTSAPSASAQSFCNSATVANLTATGTSLQWYNVATGGTALASTTALATGTYYVSQTLNSCESSRTAVAVTVNVTSAPSASAQSFCNSATVANLTATGTSLQWYNVATGGTALASTTALATGTYYVSQTLNSCESSRTAVAVTVNVTSAPTASAQSFCNSATIANLTATGTSLQWYNVATGGTALASTTALATGTYYISQTLNSCESSRTAVAVTVNNTLVPTASSQTFNSGATVANLVATGTNLQWYTVASGGTALASTTVLSTGTYYVSQTLNSCESPRAAVSVTINTAPGAPTASAQTFCNSATVANLTATGTALKWYNVATGGTALASTTVLATGTYYVSQTLNSLESSRTAVAVTVNVTSAPSASAQSFCNSATVANLTATGTSLQWYNVATGGTALASTTALATGTYYVSQTLNSCESSRTAVAVTVNVTSAPSASAQSFCNSATVANLTATGTSLQWYNVAIGGTALASTTALATGTYYISQTLNSCESSRTAVSVTVNNTSVPTALSQTFNSGATVANLVATGTNLQWYTVATGGTALASTAVLSTGTYYVSQTLNSCESPRVAVSVTINTVPGAPTASAQTFCNSATVANLTATGTSLQWYSTSTGGTALTSTTVLATGTYYVSQTVNSLESSRTAVAVTVNVTSAPSASAQSFCNSATVATLTATGTALKWYNVATGGTALASTTALATGTYYVSQTLNSCESSRTAVAVTVNVTSAPSASAQSFCNSATIANLTATGTSLQWYNVATGGTSLASTTALATGTYYVSQTLNSCESSRTAVSVTVNNTSVPTALSQTFNSGATVANLVATGTNLQWYTVATGGTALASTAVLSTGTYYVSQTLNSCESPRVSVSVTINTAPGAPTASAQSFCNSATVANLTATGTSLQWYSTSTGGTALTSTTVLATGTYYVSQTVNSIESSRTPVAVTVNVTPAPTASNQIFCGSATVANLVATGTALKWYTVTTGGTALASTFSLVSGNFYVTQTLNSCESLRTMVIVSVSNPSAPTASAQTFCNSATVANLVATGTNLKWYTVSTGGTALTSTTVLSSGTYYVSQTPTVCESPRTAVLITINNTLAPTASAQSFNNGATVADLVATGTLLQWYTVASGGTALASTGVLSTGTYYVSQTLNSCESMRTAVSVTINTAPGAPTASAQTFCNSATVANLTASGTNLQWYTVATGGTALASTTALATGTYYVSQTVNALESSRTAVAVTVNVTTVPTVSSQTFCNSATVANLTATGISIQWYDVATDGTVLASTAALSSGIYYVSQTLNSCESPRVAVAVTVNVTPAPVALAQSFCNSATIANLVATGTALKWYNFASGGTALAASTGLVTGYFYVTQTLNSCESARTQVSVTVSTATAPTVSAQTFNSGATVANLVAAGTNIQWYTASTGGTALASTALLSTGTYYVSQTVNSCESTRTAVSVTINIAPGAPTASAQTFCNSATVANLTATGTNLQWYNVATGGTALASTAALATGTYYVSQTVNSLESSRTAVAVTINITSAPTASSQTFCNSATVANLTATGTSLKWYNVATGGTALASSTALSSGTYYVSQTLNSCESTRTSVVITVNVTALPVASAQTFNSGATVASLVATGTSLQWYNVATGGSALASTSVLVTGSYYVSQTLNSCESLRRQVAVTINSTTAAPIAYAQTFCSSVKVSSLVATGTNLKWYTTATGGTALSSNTWLVSGTYYVSQTVNSIESPRTSVLVTIYGSPIARNISSTTSSGTATVPLCTSDAKLLLIGSGYSATNIQWERAVVGLNTTTAPASSAYVSIDGATGSTYNVTNPPAGKNYYRVKFTNGNCTTVAYSSSMVVYYKDCSTTAKLTAVNYPNPFKETFKLSLTVPTEDKIEVTVYDMMGKLIDSMQSNVFEISDLQLGDQYPSGTYIVVVRQGDESKTLRAVKK